MPYKLLDKGMVYHYYTQSVVVIHHAFAQKLIRHAGGAFLVNVGQNPKASQKWVEPEEETHAAWEQNRADLASQSRQIACAGNPSHKIFNSVILLFILLFTIVENKMSLLCWA